jgi:hypothetical protein
VKISLLDGSFTLVNAKGENPQGKGFSVNKLAVDFELEPLLNNQVIIHDVVVDRLLLDIAFLQNGELVVAGLPAASNSPQRTEQKNNTAIIVDLANVTFSNFKVCIDHQKLEQNFCSAFDRLAIKGRHYFETGKPAKLNIASSVELNNLDIIDKRRNETLLELGLLQLSQLSINELELVQLEQLALTDLKLLKAHVQEQDNSQVANIIAVEHLIFKQALLKQFNRLEVDSLTLEMVLLNMARSEDKGWQITQIIDRYLPKTKEEQEPENTKAQAETEKPPAFSVAIGTTQLTSKPIHYTDLDLGTGLTITSQIKQFQLLNFDSNNKEQVSQLSLDLLLGDHGKVMLAGDAQLLSDKPSFDIKGNINALDLRPVGRFLQTGFGHNIQSGLLNADINFKAQQGQLDSLLNLNLKQFKLKTLSETEQQQLSEQAGLGMPIDTALDLLRDKDNVINLSLPVTGDINNPDFALSDILFQASAKAMTTAVINYYTPFGLVTAAQGVFDLATAIKFEPITFAPGSAKLQSGNHENLAKLFFRKFQTLRIGQQTT